jgi:hypothetical protein
MNHQMGNGATRVREKLHLRLNNLQKEPVLPLGK